MKLYVDIEKELSNLKLKVSFTQDSGVLGLLGASGSGKSMTLKCIAGLVSPDKGKIILNDKVLFDSDKKINLIPQKRNIGYVFQNYALFPHMNVIQNITLGLSNINSKEKETLCNEYINKFNLKGLEKSYPHMLSGGQCQRVALARALITSPDILLLDEPFSALDSHLKSNIEQDLISILNSYKGIILYVTHDISECYRICDNIIAYNNGMAIDIRNKSDLFNSPNNINEALLTGCQNIFPANKLDDYSMYCNTLGYTFKINGKILKNATHLCIRSQDVEIYNCSEKINTFQFKVINIIENPFTFNVSFKNPDDKFNSIINIEFEKSKFDYSINDTIYLHFKSENLFTVSN